MCGPKQNPKLNGGLLTRSYFVLSVQACDLQIMLNPTMVGGSVEEQGNAAHCVLEGAGEQYKATANRIHVCSKAAHYGMPDA